MDTHNLAQHDNDALEDAIADLAVHIEVATASLLRLILEFDRREVWALQGFSGCAPWLSWRLGWVAGTAREHLRVARSLAELPSLEGAFATGRLS